MDANKQKALEALGQIERQFGKDAIMKMGEQPREVYLRYPRVHGLGCGLGYWRLALWAYCRNLWA